MTAFTQPKRVLTAVLVVPCIVAACGPEESPLPPVVWEGESIRVRMDDSELEVCGGTFEALERHTALVREALLLEGDEVIEYSIGDQDFVDSECDLVSPSACTKGVSGHVFSSDPYNPHEIVHAVRVRDPSISIRSSGIEEGLAVLFGDDQPGSASPALDAAGVLFADKVSGSQYFHAGRTMSVLLEAYGPEVLRDFDRLANTILEDDAFRDVFGQSKTDFAVYAEMMPTCEQSQWWAPLLECDGEPVVPNETGLVVLEGTLACGAIDTIGPRGGRVWTSQHFRLNRHTTTSSYDIQMPEDATLEIIGCDGGCPERLVYIGGTQEVGGVANGIPALDPGDYFLRMSRPLHDGDGSFVIGIRQLSE